jgi:hypothetical protein
MDNLSHDGKESVEQAETREAPREGRQPSAPYVSFKTFLNFLAWAKEYIPIQYDRSVLNRKYNGGLATQLMAGLRFLSLISEDRPTKLLHDLAEADETQQKALLASILRSSYTAIDFEQLDRATPKMLADWLRNHGLDGETLRKAETFFVSAAQYCGIKLSPALEGRRRAGAGPTQKRATKPSAKSSQVAPTKTVRQKQAPQHVTQANLRTVTLKSGGEVSLIVNADFLSLSDEDRSFVFDLVDKLKKYDQAPDLT